MHATYEQAAVAHLCVDVAIVSGVGLDLGLEVVVHAQRTGGQPRERGARKHGGAQGCLAQHNHGGRGALCRGSAVSADAALSFRSFVLSI